MKMKNVDELLDRIRKISAKCDGTQTSNSPEWEEIKTLIDDIIISFAVSLGPAKWDKPDRKSIVENQLSKLSHRLKWTPYLMSLLNSKSLVIAPKSKQ
jgi:hypothetical protein